MSSCIVAIAKNEELYLKEWIEYHFNLGFDKIFICDNNDIGNDSQINLIAPLKEKYDINVINVCGREILEKAGLQTGCYKFCYEYIKQNFPDINWIAYIDIDEFLNFNSMKVNEFLSQEKFNDVDLIHLNWKCYGDNDLVYYEPRPVMERFTRPVPIDAIYNTKFIPEGTYLNNHVKSILRVNDRFIEFNTPHTALYKDCKCVNCDGEIVDYTSPWQSINYNSGHIKHYITKSTEEFIKRKLNNNTRADAEFNSIIDEELINYFNINTKTYSKLELIKNYKINM